MLPTNVTLALAGALVVLLALIAFRWWKQTRITPEERERLAAKMFGRWRSGAPLTLAHDHDDPDLGADPQRNNDFTFKDDPKGRVVPLGCHMRRLNPRDSELTLLTDVNIHRIIRRSSTFGPVYSEDVGPEDDANGDRTSDA